MLKFAIQSFNELFYHPVRVLWICVILVVGGLILDGSALRLWGLHRDHQVISTRIEEARRRSRQLEFRIQEAQQPEFIERAARDQFDLVKEGDLIFIFSDEGSESQEKTTGT